ncbi:phosphopantothenoylcysteine decarboxylase isoform X2 [Bos mutus]|uniref:phosphopantothenoylcysteine decarboxylase isoform X2 n=1 Tax=Bos mutus TaxID=72004 RepID=UPI0038B5C495
MEPNSGRLPGLEATGPQMEPRATSSAAAPLRRQFHVLVGVTGSVAALKLPLLVSKLLDIPDLEVAVVTTERAKHFYSPRDVPVTLYSDADEWEMWKRRSDPVLHIDLRRWADLMLVAPLDANTLGKVASGICDNLLTCVIRAWDRSKPLLFCPAMNTAMWEHPITEQQVGQLKDFGYIEIPCVAKKLVCGDQVAQSCLTFCNPMDCSTPGFPVLHHLPELAQTHVHRVDDAIQPSHPLSSPSPPAFSLSQHQGPFQ